MGSHQTTARQVRALESQSCPWCEDDLPWVLVTAGYETLGYENVEAWRRTLPELDPSWEEGAAPGAGGAGAEGRTPGSWDSDP